MSCTCDHKILRDDHVMTSGKNAPKLNKLQCIALKKKSLLEWFVSLTKRSEISRCVWFVYRNNNWNACNMFLTQPFFKFKYSGTSAIRNLSFPRHPTKIYGSKVLLSTKIRPEYSDILYNPTHFPGPLVRQIRQVPLYHIWSNYNYVTRLKVIWIKHTTDLRDPLLYISFL